MGRLHTDIPRVPRVQTGFVVRPDLDAILDALPEGGWLSVVAPSGFGKTQLAAYWFDRAVAAGNDARWAQSCERLKGDCCFVDNARGTVTPFRGRARLITFSRTPLSCSARFPDAVIGTEEMRLSVVASTALVEARGGLSADHGAIAACEGWPPALNLHAQSPALTSEVARDALLAAFLESQVMRSVAPEDRRALADLALLPDLEAEMTAVALDRGDIETLKDRLARDTPFFKRSNGRLRLAAFAKRFLLGRKREVSASPIHRRAAEWHLERASLGAVPHLLALDEIDRVVTILGEQFFDFVTGGDLATALDWLERIGPTKIAANPQLSLAAAHAYATAGDSAQAARYLARHHADERLVLQGTLASHADDADTAEHILAQVVDTASLGPVTSTIYQNLTSWIAQKRGQWSNALNQAQLDSYQDAPELLLSQSYGRCRAARWNVNQGRAGAAISLLEPLLKAADARVGHMSAPSALVASILAYAQLQIGDCAGAQATLAGRLDAIRVHNVAGAWATGMIAQSRLAVGRNDQEGAMAALDLLNSLALSRDVLNVQTLVVVERIRLMVRTGTKAGAIAIGGTLERLCSEARELCINGPHIRLDALIGLGHLALAQGNDRGASGLFREAGEFAFKLQRVMDAAEIMLVCPDALSAAQRSKIVETVEARDFDALRQRLGVGPADVERSAATAAEVQLLDRSQSAVSLTSREQDVLSQLGLHRSNKMIAREIGLSGETVKWHIANILAKLGAHDRSHAVERARSLGLLTATRPGL